MSKRKAEAVSNGVFLIALGILFYTNKWWPGILIAIWAALAIRQYFTHRIYDLCLTTAILAGIFIISFFNFKWDILMPVLFVVAGIYLIFREYFFSEDSNGEEKAKEIQDDYDDAKRP
jgi:predicted membrane protein